jgi:hypothetical protein
VAGFTDALRGYALSVHRRDGFRCRYCGLDGTEAFAYWLSLSWDHLLPKGHPNRDNLDYIVTACSFCNTADNRYFDLAPKRGVRFDGLTPDQLVAQRLPYVQATREHYREFWKDHVHADMGAEPIAGSSGVPGWDSAQQSGLPSSRRH